MGRGPGGAADRNPEIAPAGQGRPTTARAVDGSDGDDVEPKKAAKSASKAGATPWPGVAMSSGVPAS